MQYLLTPHNKKFSSYAFWDNAFNFEELNWLQSKAKQASQQAEVGDSLGGSVNSNIRRSELSWLSCKQENVWVFQRLAHIVSSLNSEFFFFDLTGFGEDLQLTNYDEKYVGAYGWHVDFGNNTSTPSRKLSLVLQLSDPVDYEGGVLELRPYGQEIIKISKKRGLIVCFPSWTLHQVTPVTKGNRQSLVSWISGPSFI